MAHWVSARSRMSSSPDGLLRLSRERCQGADEIESRPFRNRTLFLYSSAVCLRRVLLFHPTRGSSDLDSGSGTGPRASDQLAERTLQEPRKLSVQKMVCPERWFREWLQLQRSMKALEVRWATPNLGIRAQYVKNWPL